MIPRNFNRQQRDAELRRMPLHRDPDTAWDIISSSPGALIGSLAVMIALCTVAIFALALIP